MRNEEWNEIFLLGEVLFSRTESSVWCDPWTTRQTVTASALLLWTVGKLVATSEESSDEARIITAAASSLHFTPQGKKRTEFAERCE